MHKIPSSSTLGAGGLDLTQAFFKPISNADAPFLTKRHAKISVIGAGNVGMAIAQTILTQDLTDELVLVDAKPDKLRGEMLDLQHAAAFLPRTKIIADVDYAVTVGSDLCIVTVSARQIVGKSRLPHHHRTKMAPSESASATETPKLLAPSFGMLLSFTNFAPFLRASPSSLSSKKPRFVLPEIPALIASTADKCSKLLRSLASQNPLLSKLISLRCEFQSICHQIQGSHIQLFGFLGIFGVKP